MDLYDSNGNPVYPGNLITDFRGDEWEFVRISRFPEGPREGKIEVRQDGDQFPQERYPSVFPGYAIR